MLTGWVYEMRRNNLTINEILHQQQRLLLPDCAGSASR